MTGIFPMVIQGALIVAVLMFVLWLYQVKTKNAGVVDIGWSLGIFVMAAVYFVQGDGYIVRKSLILVMAFLWSFRLVLVLIQRMRYEKEEDKRYQKIRREWGEHINAKFFLFFEGQAVLCVLLSLPFLFAVLNTAPGLLAVEVLGVIIWAIGYLGEMTADEQLRQFKQNPVNKGKTCRVGLWNYSRHPNYFFEWLIWVGYFIFALGSPGGWAAVICPLVMLVFLLKVTGIPATEAQALRTRGEEYKRYQETTSMFVPWLKKRAK